MVRRKTAAILVLGLVLAGCGDKKKEEKEPVEPTTVEWVGRDGLAEGRGLIILLEVKEGVVTSGVLRPFEIGSDSLEHFGADGAVRNIVQTEKVVTFEGDVLREGKRQGMKFEIEFTQVLDKAKDPLIGALKKDGGKGVEWRFSRR